MFDLRNSLGHFDADVAVLPGSKRRYTISDTYEFGFKKNDKAQTGRHGFPIGHLSKEKLQIARTLLPSTKYHNPGGFEETWEIHQSGRETILLIPQKFLDEQGKKFTVTGVFER